MENKIILHAAQQIAKAYKQPQFNYLSTEWSFPVVWYQNIPIQVIAIAGTNDATDWLWNIFLSSWDGVKLASYYASKRILKKFVRIPSMPLLICGHSKSGPTAMYLGKLLNADYVIAFNPAPGFRKREKLKNTLVIIDPDDIVHHLGKLNFKQPNCEVYTLPEDKTGFSIKDHSIMNSINHFKGKVK